MTEMCEKIIERLLILIIYYVILIKKCQIAP